MRSFLFLLYFGLACTLGGGAGGLRPDVIVTHLSRTPTTLTVHLQNLGPGRATEPVHLNISRQSDPRHQIGIEVAAPQGVFAVSSSSPVSLEKLGIPSNWSSELIKVEIQSRQAQARQSNKDFYEQIERQDGVTHNDSQPYQEDRPDLPDLVVERVIYEAPSYVRVVYRNNGRGRTGADFVIGLRTGERSFPVNHFYRYRVPPPGQSHSTGGYTIGILGLQPGMKAQLTATIDPEGRVRETNPKNNVWTGVLELKP
ncbi:hypothetical protein JST97_00265 [bacterium]|nr:hypothetical protein [bacterium]